MTAPPVRWLTIYLDTPQASSSRAFWRDATGYALSGPRGEHDEFATLLPPVGDAHVRVQATGPDVAAAHLDLHVDDLDAAVSHATGAGAEVVARPGHAWLRSPGGCDFCLVPHEGEHDAAPPAVWPGGHRSRLDQLTVDVAHEAWSDERRFWVDLTGWPVAATARSDLARLHTPPELPVRVLLQRRVSGPTTAHVDLATDDRPAEVARLEALGARAVGQGPSWTVVAVPGGARACVTDRRPETGLLG